MCARERRGLVLALKIPFVYESSLSHPLETLLSYTI